MLTGRRRTAIEPNNEQTGTDLSWSLSNCYRIFREFTLPIEIDVISERLGEISGTLRAIQRQIDSLLTDHSRMQDSQRKIEAGQTDIVMNAAKRDDRIIAVERQFTEVTSTLTKEVTTLRGELQEIKEMRWKASGFFLAASMLAGGTGGLGLSKLLEWMSVHLK
jgi:hypothetical protein